MAKHRSSETVALKNFIRIQREFDRIDILADLVAWHGQAPASDWLVACCLPSQATEAEVAGAIRAVLADQRYFLTCEECGERLPRGMTTSVTPYGHKITVCHGCATRKYFVVF